MPEQVPGFYCSLHQSDPFIPRRFPKILCQIANLVCPDNPLNRFSPYAEPVPTGIVTDNTGLGIPDLKRPAPGMIFF